MRTPGPQRFGGSEADDADGYISPVKRVAGWLRPAWVEVDLAAVTANVAHICEVVAPSAVCAVVKADGYGHGAVPVARAAIAGGAAHLGVALAEEGHELRQAGIDVAGDRPVGAGARSHAARRRGQAHSDHLHRARSRSVARRRRRAGRCHAGAGPPEGRHRVCTAWAPARPRSSSWPAPSPTTRRCPSRACTRTWLWRTSRLTRTPRSSWPPSTASSPRLAAGGIRARLSSTPATPPARSCTPPRATRWSGRGSPSTGWRRRLRCEAIPPCGLCCPALSFKAEVSYAKEVAAGEGLSYGLHYRLSAPSVIATVPVGYADGAPRRLSQVGGEVLIGGRRRPIAGSVTMDQILVDCGPGAGVKAGDEVVLIGRQGDEEVTAWEWGERLGTIAYEVTCALSPRLPRIYT